MRETYGLGLVTILNDDCHEHWPQYYNMKIGK